MLLYSRTGATSLNDAEHGQFEVDEETGAFEVPEELGERLCRFHVGKQPAWESDIERQERLMLEDADRRRDPATLLSVVEKLVLAAQKVAPLTESEPAPKAAPRARKAPAKSSE